MKYQRMTRRQHWSFPCFSGCQYPPPPASDGGNLSNLMCGCLRNWTYVENIGASQKAQEKVAQNKVQTILFGDFCFIIVKYVVCRTEFTATYLVKHCFGAFVCLMMLSSPNVSITRRNDKMTTNNLKLLQKAQSATLNYSFVIKARVIVVDHRGSSLTTKLTLSKTPVYSINFKLQNLKGCCC